MATAAVRALYSHDAGRDTRPADAARRALPWLSDQAADEVARTTPIAAPGATWTTWAAHRAVVTAHITAAADDRPPDTHNDAYRQLAVDQHPRGRDGWAAAPVRTTVFVVLVRQHGGWLVDRVTPR